MVTPPPAAVDFWQLLLCSDWLKKGEKQIKIHKNLWNRLCNWEKTIIVKNYFLFFFLQFNFFYSFVIIILLLFVTYLFLVLLLYVLFMEPHTQLIMLIMSIPCKLV